MSTVWVVDDEESVCGVLEAMLRELGYDVQIFKSGQDVLEAYGKHPPNVVITDMRMPRMNGMEVTRALLEIDRDAIVMLLTGYPSIADAVEAIKMGATDFLSKPCRLEEIRVRVERAIEGRDTQVKLRKSRKLLWALIISLPFWCILGMILARGLV